jgi:hypothetical protein
VNLGDHAGGEELVAGRVPYVVGGCGCDAADEWLLDTATRQVAVVVRVQVDGEDRRGAGVESEARVLVEYAFTPGEKGERAGGMERA